VSETAPSAVVVPARVMVAARKVRVPDRTLACGPTWSPLGGPRLLPGLLDRLDPAGLSYMVRAGYASIPVSPCAASLGAGAGGHS